jgi:CheY-like chemotaxis protein
MSTVLVVDDEQAIGEILATALVDAGYDAQAVSSGEAALQYVDRHPVDLILSDVMMPCFSGYDLLARLRERANGPPVILMSAGVQPERNRGHIGFLKKPFELDDLYQVVERSLETSSVHG